VGVWCVKVLLFLELVNSNANKSKTLWENVVIIKSEEIQKFKK
jgi:hypothetical protein